METKENVASGSKNYNKKLSIISTTSSFSYLPKVLNETYTEEGIATADQYNPHLERDIKKPISDLDVFIHLIKGSIGAGILAMPKAFQDAGLLPGTIGTALIGILCIHSFATLIKMQYIQCKRLKVAAIIYPLSMKVALINGPKCLRPLAFMAPVVVDLFLVFFQLGVCTAYVIFMAESIKSIMEPHFVQGVDLKIYLIVLFFPVLLINFIRNLRRLSPVSLIANFLVIIAFSCCFYYIFFVGPWKEETCNIVSPVMTWPLFIGIALFSIEAVGVVLSVEYNMQNPERFLGCKGIFTWSMVVVVILYIFVGFVGYIKYGNEVKGTIVATLPQNEWLSVSIGGVYAICIYGTYPLQMYVALEILWVNYIGVLFEDSKMACCIEYMLRTVAVMLTFILAIIIPYIDIVISFVGVFALSTLGISFPFLIELCTLYPDQLSWPIFFKDLLFIIFGLFILVVGTYVSLYTLITLE